MLGAILAVILPFDDLRRASHVARSEGCEVGESGLLRRLIDDPLVARRWGWRLLAVGLLCVAGGQLLGDGFAGGMLTALAWIVVPVIAFAIGYGEAFFLQYGRGQRRVLLLIITGALTSLVSCVVVSSVAGGENGVGQWVNLTGSLILYGGIVAGLSGLVALGIGRGSGYVTRKIDDMRSDDW